jgi:Protein of unknown function (DUF1156)
MIPKNCKRLAEVDFPIAAVSRQAAREKSIRHGHPSTLHLWWARRPLASSRAVLLAILWPDPCDRLCPEEFKTRARTLLPHAPACNPGTTDQELPGALLKFIADFANWDLASNRTYLDISRALVKAAHGEEPPLTVDPFAGGGSRFHAAPVRRPNQRAAHAAQGGERARTRFLAPRQRALSPLSEGQRGKAAARRNAPGFASVITCSISPMDPT